MKKKGVREHQRQEETRSGNSAGPGAAQPTSHPERRGSASLLATLDLGGRQRGEGVTAAPGTTGPALAEGICGLGNGAGSEREAHED